MTYWKLSNIPDKATDKQLRLPQAINHIPNPRLGHSCFSFQLWNLFWCTFLFLQPNFFINASWHIDCAIQKPMYVKKQTIRLCKCYRHSQIPTIILLLVWSNHHDVKCSYCMIQQLLATGAMHPQTSLNPCTTFMLCLPMSGLELPVCSVEVLYCLCYALGKFS